MKTALISGGTGLVGKSLVKLLRADTRYSKITSLVRKPNDIIHERLSQVEFGFDNQVPSLVIADEVFCCLGTTIGAAGSKPAFYKVGHDYVLNTATSTFANGTKKFALVSSMEANKRSSFFYSKVKGETEEDLAKIKWESLFIFRPSLLLGKRPQSRMVETVAGWLMVNLSFMLPKKYKPVKGSQAAHAMTAMMNSNRAGAQILESDEIARL